MITKLKAKNQITLPIGVVKRLNLKPHEFFTVDVEDNVIRLVPVEISPRYTPEELKGIDTIVDKEKAKAKAVSPGKEFSAYIKKVIK